MSSVTLLQSRTEAAVPNPTASAAALGPNPAPSFTIGLLHYDPAAAARPDLKLTPADPLPDATVEDVCAPRWGDGPSPESLREKSSPSTPWYEVRFQVNSFRLLPGTGL